MFNFGGKIKPLKRLSWEEDELSFYDLSTIMDRLGELAIIYK
jgi:hypothetical protein